VFAAYIFSDFAAHLRTQRHTRIPKTRAAGQPDPVTRRRTFRNISAAVITVIVLATAAVGLSVWRDREQALSDQMRQGRNTATMFAGQIARSIQAIDIVLRQLQAVAETNFDRTDADGLARIGTIDFHSMLSSRTVTLPQALHILVIDHLGDAAASSSSFPVPAFNVHDRDYFAELKWDTGDRLSVSLPVENRISGEPALVFARRLSDPGGGFRGIVFVSVRASYFDDIFRTVDSLSGQTFVIARTDGTVLHSYPSFRVRAGDQIVDYPDFAAAIKVGGNSYRLVGSRDGQTRWAAVHPLTDYPLAISTTVPERVLLADWWASAAMTAAQTLMLLVVAVLLLGTIARQFRELAASERSLRSTSHKLDTALNNMSQGLAMFDADSRLIVSNEHFRAMFALPAALIAPGTTIDDILAHCRSQLGWTEDDEKAATDRARMLTTYAESTHDIPGADSRLLAARDVRMLDGGWVATFGDVTERRAVEAHIQRLAHYDALTGIANRSRFLERLAEAEAQLTASTQPFAMLLLDLDQFKRVNDSLGHVAGDTLLKEVAQRLERVIGESDIPARLGGDEFAVIQKAPRLFASLAVAQADMRGSAAALAGRILAAIGHPFEIDGHSLVIGASIGIAIAPYDGVDSRELLKRADLALYKIKSEGRNAYAFFDAALAARAEQRHRLEADLRAGLGRGEFELFFQPQVDATTRQPRGVEALVRWRHPDDGLVLPDRFIPLAEDTGLIHPLGEWILTSACETAQHWPDHITVAVNISPVQFANADLAETVSRALERSGLPPHRLELEITERVLLDADEGNLDVLHRLKALGISIALDDFGTGYSSLSYLTLFPFDKIKIDRSFTRHLLERDNCAAITAAVINLGRSLDVVTIAEGVETEAQYEALRLAGASQMQGFLFGLPAPADEIRFEANDDGNMKFAGVA
jgi:diguanylate cyclase (GGDEF)-like protein